MTGINYCDTETEYFELLDELEENPDFTLIGHYELLNEVYEELNYQGLKDDYITELTTRLYGPQIEILEYNSCYVAFIGCR